MSTYLRKILLPLLLMISCGGFAPHLYAQSTGTIRGTVADTLGANIPGATVTAINSATGLKRTQLTNDSGIYVFTDLPIGSYTIEASDTGFAPQRLTGADLLTGQILGLDITLAIGTQTDSITVTSARDVIQTATSEVATSVDEKQMEDLPLNGRNALQLTTLTPGAALTSVGTESGQQDNVGLTVNGLRATQNNYELDGASYINRFFDSVPILPSPDGLQEFTIQAANFSAEYPGAGALVQLSTRSGTNDFHGSAFEFLRNTVLNARNYFQTTVPPFKLNQFGGTIGGPIRRDKTFFFFSAEDLQQRSSPNPISIQVPTAPQLSGDFSALLTLATPIIIYNPTTGLPYANNVITTPINSLSKAVANAFLTPLRRIPLRGSITHRATPTSIAPSI